jgi:hypothetical protein
MIVAIQADDYPDGPSAPRWADLLADAGHPVRWVNVYHADILKQLRGCDGFMWRYGQRGGMVQIAQRLLPVIERELGLMVYPDQNTCWHFDDKIAQAHLFEALRIPTPRTWVWFEADAARRWAATARYPVVLKLWAGASSENVRLVRSAREAEWWIGRLFGNGVFQLSERWVQPLGPRSRIRAAAKMLLRGTGPPPPEARWDLHKNYVLFQEFLPGNDFDTRVTVIGKRAFGFRRSNRPGDFRASGSGRIDWNQEALHPSAFRLAFEVAARLRTQSVAIDLLRKGADLLVAEVSYTYNSRAVHDCPGHWELDGAPESGELTWRDGHMWPEEAQVADLLARLRHRTGESASGESAAVRPAAGSSAAARPTTAPSGVASPTT